VCNSQPYCLNLIMLYKDIIHISAKEKIAFDKYIKSKNTSGIDWFNLWLEWLQERDKKPEYEWELEETL